MISFCCLHNRHCKYASSQVNDPQLIHATADWKARGFPTNPLAVIIWGRQNRDSTARVENDVFWRDKVMPHWLVDLVAISLSI